MKRSSILYGIVPKPLVACIIVCFASLVCSTRSQGQTTVFTDPFSSGASGVTVGASTGTVTGATSYTAYTSASGGFFSATTGLTASALNIVGSNGTTFRSTTTITGSLNALASPFNKTLHSNNGIITWTFNIRNNKSTAQSPLATAFATGAAASTAVVLITDNPATSNISAASGNTAKGWAVTLTQGTTTAVNRLDLGYFTSGLTNYDGATNPGGFQSIITSGDLSGAIANYFSVKVTYDPSTDTWALYQRNDGAITAADPTSNLPTPLVQAGVSTINTINTLNLMTNFTFYYNFNNSNTALWDNFKVVVGESINAPSPSLLSGFAYAVGSGPSAEQSFSISAPNLSGNLVIVPPADYEISTTSSSGSGFVATNPVIITPANAVSGNTIYVRLKAGLPIGNYNNESIILSSNNAPGKTVVCNGVVNSSATPEVVISTSSLSAFANTAAGANSTAGSFTISGNYLGSNNVNVTAPANFEVSLSSSSGFGTSVALTPVSGSVATTTIYVRYSPTGSGGYIGNVVVTNALVSDQNVAVSGYLSIFYFKAGLISAASSWSGTADGTGTSVPVNFTTAGVTYKILTNKSTDAPWTVSGTGSKIVVGDPSAPPVSFTIINGNAITTTLPVVMDITASSSGSNSLLVQDFTTLPVLGTLHASSEVHYQNTTSSTVALTSSYSYGKFFADGPGTGQLQVSGNNTIQTSLVVAEGSTMFISGASAIYFTINSGADVTINGKLRIQKITGFIVSGVTGTSGGSIQFPGTENVTLGVNSIIEYNRGSNATTYNISPRTYANLTISGLDNNKIFSGPTTVNGIFTLSITGSSILSNCSNLTLGNGATIVRASGSLDAAPIFGTSVNLKYEQNASVINSGVEMPVSSSVLNDLTINSSNGLSLSGTSSLNGTLYFGNVNNSTLTTNGNLVLKSGAAGTARIADLTNNGVNTGNNISGNVTVERWIKLRAGGDGRAYRLLTPTVSTTGSIQANWMEGGMNTAIGTNVNLVPNFGTQITGAGGNANGFDVTQSNAPSLYATTNAVVPTYTAIGNTNGTLNALTGYFLYLRGDRSMNMQLPLAPNMPTSSTTLRTTGTVVQGTQTAFTNPFTGGGALNLVTNPYPSPINWSLVRAASTGITNFYTLWDPNFGTRGGFVTVSTAGVASSGLATQFIQPGQAFFVESDGGMPSVSIQESHKAAGNNNEVFLTPPPPVEAFRTELYITEPNAYRRVVDGAIVLFDNNYSTAVDNHDAKEINNWDENIAIARNGKHLAIEGRPVILSKDTIPLFMNNMKQQAYEFEFTPAQFTHIGLKAELADNFLNTRTLLSVVNPTVVSFTVTADPASKATDRFKVVFGPFGGTLAVDALTIKAQARNNGVQVDWVSKSETDMAGYEVERATFGNNFIKVNTTTAVGNSPAPVSYKWFDADPNMGTNFYRVKAFDRTGNVKYSDIVKVIFGKGEPGIAVYPNPMEGRAFKMDMNNMAKGTYLLNLYNNMGQLVYTEQLQHDGNQATRTINLQTGIATGAYQLQLSSDNGFKTTQTIFKN